MTLRQAYTQWALIRENTVMAAKYRTAINSVLIKNHGDRDVRELTAFQVRRIMKESLGDRIQKVQAASALIGILKYASGKNECVRPDFDISIVTDERNVETPHPNEEPCTVISERPKPGKTIKKNPKQPSATNRMTRKKGKGRVRHTKHLQKLVARIGGKRACPVCQLDVKTLEVVGCYDSQSDAGTALGVSSKNISSAMRRKGQAFGFYWCKAGEASSFVPGTRKTKITTEKRRENTKNSRWKNKVEGEIQEVIPQQEPLSSTASALSGFSDAELRDELSRRGWYGTLYMRLDFEIKK